MPVFLPQRQQFLLEKDARREFARISVLRLDVLQRGIGQPVFPGQPLEHLLLRFRPRLARETQARQSFRIHGGELVALRHARGKIGKGGVGFGN